MKRESKLVAARKRASEAKAEFEAAVAAVVAHPNRKSRDRASRATVKWGVASAVLHDAEVAAGIRTAPRPPVYSREIVARIQLTASAARRLSASVRVGYPRNGLAGLLADGIEGIVTTGEGIPARAEPFRAGLHVEARMRQVRS